MLRHWFLILLSFIVTYANAQNCPSTCPTGGIWSDWSTTETCATTCGACSKITYTRTCLSVNLDGGCACTGNSSLSLPCGTQACNYPRNNGSGVTCCTGTPMVINNWYHCGPLASNNSLTCCPDGGYWSKWSAWQKQDGKIQWTRNRTCLSGGLACPCVGDTIETKYTCPCAPVDVISDSQTCATVTSKTAFSVRTPVYNAGRCVTTFIAEATNYRHEFFTNPNGVYVTTIGWTNTTGICQTADIAGLGNASTAGSFFKIDFPCNLTTGLFGADLNTAPMFDLVKMAQFY